MAMLAGKAAVPITAMSLITCRIPERLLSAMLASPQTPQIAIPLASHFSCWRRSPLARRWLTACWIMQVTKKTDSTVKKRSWAMPHGTAAPVG